DAFDLVVGDQRYEYKRSRVRFSERGRNCRVSGRNFAEVYGLAFEESLPNQPLPNSHLLRNELLAFISITCLKLEVWFFFLFFDDEQSTDLGIEIFHDRRKESVTQRLHVVLVLLDNRPEL